MDLLELAVKGKSIFCFVIRKDDEEHDVYIHPGDLPNGEPTEFEVGFNVDKYGWVVHSGETCQVDTFLKESVPENGHCYKYDLCAEHKESR